MNRYTKRTVLTLAVIALAGCGGSDAQLEPRFVAVHNAMQAMGMATTGPISEGSLPEGADAQVEAELEAGECYTFVALGDSRVDDIDLRILDDSGEEVGRDTTHDRQSAAQVCPEHSGVYQVVVRMAAGQGGYTMASWSGGVSGGAIARAGGSHGGTAGTCEDPIPIEIGRPVQGDTTGGQSAMQASCASGSSPEKVYLLHVDDRVQMQAVLQSGYDGALYVMRTCGNQQSEIVCNDDDPDTSRSAIQATLDPGDYYVVVDGYGDEAGTFDLIVSVSPLQDVAAVCSDADPLPVGQPVSGATTGQANYFQATCAGGAASGDHVYYLDVPQRSRLRLSQQTDHDGALHVRRTCEEATTEIACNDDYVDRQHSLITTVVDQGRYYVFTDGFSSGSEGNYTLTAELAPDTGGAADGEDCSAAGQIAPGQQVSIDTFQARDDYAGSCGGQGAPDVVYDLSVRNRSRLRVNVAASQFAGVTYVRRQCTDATTELACTQIAQGAAGALDTVVQPGSYSVIIDGQRPDTFGSADVSIQLDDLAALERECRRAPLIRPGRVVTGDTSGEQDGFQASCAGGARSGDIVYRIRVTRPSLVRVNMSSDYDGALHLRSDCIDPTSELACNDDHNDNRHSFIEQQLQRGTYYLVVDGFSTGNQGPFTLDVDVSPQ